MSTPSKSSSFDDDLPNVLSTGGNAGAVALVQLLWRSGSADLSIDQAVIFTALARYVKAESSSVKHHQNPFAMRTLGHRRHDQHVAEFGASHVG
jgi:hypothetical protein